MSISPIAHADFGTYTSKTALTLKRILPGPIDRVWAYLVQSELRKLWLAEGTMTLETGAEFELIWRNDELSNEARPEGFAEVSRARCRVLVVEAPRLLCFDWPGVGEVRFELENQGEQVLLSIAHSRLSDRHLSIMVGAGWHMHSDILRARLRGEAAPSFWSGWLRLRDLYQQRAPA